MPMVLFFSGGENLRHFEIDLQINAVGHGRTRGHERSPTVDLFTMAMQGDSLINLDRQKDVVVMCTPI